jgi:type I restriction enzyme S subunit
VSAAAILDAPSAKAWPLAKLADVADIVNGGTPKSNVAEFWDGEHQWLTPADMGKMAGREIAQTPRTITAMGLAKSSARLAPPKSVILSTRAPIGHLAINAVPMAFNQGCRALVPGPRLDHVFLYYFLLHSRELLNDLGTGTTFKELSAASLKTVQIPLPPLEEQRRIVAVLDQAFAALDRARALAEANLADLESLSSSASQSVFGGIEGDWLTLGELCEIYQPKTISAKDLKPDGAYTVFGANGPIGRYDQFNHEEAQLLVTCRGATCGSINVSEPFSWITGNAMVVRPKDGRISADYLEQFFRGAMDWSAVITGAAQPQITRQSLAPTLVPVPDRQTQDRQASELKALQGKLAQMKVQIEAKLNDLADLRQSFLQKAFAGELT